MPDRKKPVWLRSWYEDTGRLHLEIRNPEMDLVFDGTQRGKDHTYHIYLIHVDEEGRMKE